MGDQFLAPNSASAETTGDVAEEQLPVYAGKWTQEEERYAQFLMEEFRSGNIPGLENGASMRHYLAKMLICRPKRVTKKYERTGYNGKLTYQANQVQMTPQQAQERRQQLAILRAKFLESRKQRLCLVMPTSLKPSPAPVPSPAAASPSNLTGPSGNAQATLMGALEAPSSLLGNNNLPPGLSGIASHMPSSALMNYGGIGASVGPSFMATQASRNNLSAYSLFGSGASAPAGSAGSLSSPLMRGMAGLNQSSGITNSLLASMQNMQSTPLQQQRSASLLLPNERLAPGSTNFSLTQQNLIAQLQRENEQRASLQELVTRQNLMAGLQIEQERKLALQQLLNNQYQRNTGTAAGAWQQRSDITSEAAAAPGSHGSAFEGQQLDLLGRAGLKRDTIDEPDDGLMQQWHKKPRGF